MLDPTDQERLATACRFAVEHHAGQVRKGTTIPYVSHLMQVSGLVLEHGGSVDQALAGLLHDAIEDCPDVTAQMLEDRFGADVRRMVEDCTDSVASEAGSEKRPWRPRKERYLAHLAEVAPQSLLVSLCDKTHNLGCIVADILEHGPATLERFSAGPDQQLWYFGEISRITGPHVPGGLRRRFDELLERFRDLVTSQDTGS